MPKPDRYEHHFERAWDDALALELRPSLRILDVGSGRRPAIPLTARPPGCHYVGLDISLTELEAAPQGSYDRMVVADIVSFHPELDSSFDLVISWQVLEHVKPLGAALENIRRYLVPGGTFVAHLSGRFAVFAFLNRLVPHRMASWALEHFLGRPRETVFPAHYDRCWHGALVVLMAQWSKVRIEPRFHGGQYFAFIRPLERLYYVYENWAARGEHRNLATHYLLVGRR